MSDTRCQVESGFYDAVNHDRVYSADQMNEPYKMLLTEGIIEGGFAVTQNSPAGMSVLVAPGNALLGGKWVASKTQKILTVPDNPAMYGRYDAVILQVDTNSSVREAALVYRTGTPAADPTVPSLINTGGISEVMLAYITVAAGATSISTSYIHDTRGSEDCPYIMMQVGDAQIQAAVEDVLEDHPEWTTTVEDGSITVQKFASGVIDNTLTQAGAAADAKATGDALTALNNDLSVICGGSFINLNKGHYINTNYSIGTVIDYSNPGTSSVGLNCGVINCSEGDQFSLFGAGGSSALLWAFVDSNNKLIAKSKTNAGSDSGTIITAPPSSAKLIVNVKGVASTGAYKTLSEASTEPKTIPSEYEPLEYLESCTSNNSVCGIDTGLDLRDGLRFEFDGSFTENISNNFFGRPQLYVSEYPIRSSFGINPDNGFLFGIGGANYYIPNADTKRHKFFIDVPNLSYGVDGSSISVQSVQFTDVSSVANIYLFGTENGTANSKQRLYNAKLYDYGMLVADFYPCKRRSDGKLGVYDIVRNAFYTSSSATNVGFMLNDIVEVNNAIDTIAKITQMKYHYSLGASDPHPLTMLWSSDLHANGLNYARINEFKDFYDQYIDICIQTGDVVDNPSNNPDLYMNGDTLNVIGNHDTLKTVYDWTNIRTEQETYEIFIEPFISDWEITVGTNVCYYYKDFTDSKIRLICLDVMHNTTAQQNWFVSTLLDAYNNGYEVIIASHVPPQKNPGLIPLNTPWHDIVYNGDIPWTTDYPRWVYEEYRNAVDDFVEYGGTVICWISGHQHYDVCGSWHDILAISVTTAGQLNSAYNARANGNKTQDAFNILAVDPVYKIVKLMRVGQDYSVGLQHLDTLCWDYANSKLIDV